jgi:methylmalonyl-CoA/ethylmalonyl-CoA epimerase
MNPSRVHHVGYVTVSIVEWVNRYAAVTGLTWDGCVIVDPLQMVKVAFLGSGTDGSALIELVEPAGRRSPVNKFLASGGGLHHVCLEVVDLRAHISASQTRGCSLVRVPMPAVAFNGRKIAWITTPDGQLLELLQGPRAVTNSD